MIAPGGLAPPEVEALQASREVAEAWGVAAVRPCIALIFQQGAGKGAGRQPLAHVLGLEMDSLGLPVETIHAHLRDWNTRVYPALKVSEIRKVTRWLERPGRWPYSCKHPSLAVYCIGEGCPSRSVKGLWKLSQVTADGLTESGWLPFLTGSEVRLYLGLYRLARLKGRGPEAEIPFTFAELEQHSGVNRGHVREVISRLHEKGLVAALVFSKKKGEPSRFRFPPLLPTPGTPINKGGK